MIQDETAYNAVMARIEELLPLVGDDTPKDDRNLIELDILSGLAADYEEAHYPIEPPSLASVMRLRMEEMGLTREGLASMLGTSLVWVDNFFMGKEEPSFSIAKHIRRELGIDGNIVLGGSF